MNIGDALLEDLLVVQFARHYGVADLTAAAQGLAKSPLLTEDAKHKTAEEMQAQLKRISGREQLALYSDLDTLFSKLRKRKVDELIKAIREQEVMVERIKQQATMPETASPRGAADVPNAEMQVQETRTIEHTEQDDAIAANSASKPMIAPSEEQAELVDEIMKDVSDGETETDAHTSREATVAPAEEKAEENTPIPTATEEEDTPATSTNETIKEEQEPTKMAPPAVPVQESTDELSEPEAEEEVHADVQLQEPEQVRRPRQVSKSESRAEEGSTAEPEEAAQVEPTPRGRRKRSDTMNTSVSVDSTATASRRGRRKTILPATPMSEVPANMTETESIALKKFQSTIIPVLANISSHKFGSLFSQAVSDKDAPNYSKVVHQPIDLKSLKAQIKSGQITNTNAFHKKLLHMLSNAIMYNQEGSEVSKMAKELAEHCESVVAMYRAAEFEPEQEDTRTPKRRRKQ